MKDGTKRIIELRRVVITGLGMVTPLGTNVRETWGNLISGKSGISTFSLLSSGEHGNYEKYRDPFDLSIPAGKVKNFNVRQNFAEIKKDLNQRALKHIRHMDLADQFALAASLEAINDSGLSSEGELEKAGVFIATGFGGVSSWEEQHKKFMDGGIAKVSPFLIPRFLSNLAGGNVSIFCKAKGPNVSLSTACAAGAHSIGLAFRSIRYNEADIIITGGTEAAITPLTYAGFYRMGALSTRYDNGGDHTKSSRPFDIMRDGFVMGEGAGIIVLEELEQALKRDAKIYGEIVGFGMTGDADHITTPCLEGVIGSMELAMKDAGIAADIVDYVNPHATSTLIGDKNEARALLEVFGKNNARPMISATKSATAHLLGASGAIEAIFTVKALEEGVVPPTINLEEVDPDCEGLNHVMKNAVQFPISHAISNSFGFGGTNASIVFKRWEG